MNEQNSSNEAKTPLATSRVPRDSQSDVCIRCGKSVTKASIGPPINDDVWYHLHNGLVWCVDPAVSFDTEASPPAAQTTTVTDHSPASPPESASSISSTLAEIKERQADGYEKVSKGHIGNAAVAAINDVRILRGIISSLQGEIKELQNESAALMRIVVNAAEEDCLRGRRVHCAELETNAADWCVACQAKYVLKETK